MNKKEIADMARRLDHSCMAEMELQNRDLRTRLSALEAALKECQDNLKAQKKLYDEDTETIIARCKHERDSCLSFIHDHAITEDMLREESKMRVAWKKEASRVPELEAYLRECQSAYSALAAKVGMV